MSLELVEENFGKEVRERIERVHIGPWEIRSALKTDWTKSELNPPTGVDERGWTRNLAIPAGGKFDLIVNSVRDEYPIHSRAHAVKRLARYGLPVIIEKWEDEFTDLRNYRRAGNKMAQYRIEDPSLYSLTQERSTFSVDWGRKSQQGRSQIRIIWYQKQLVESISECVGKHQYEILQWAILVSGLALGDIGVLVSAAKEHIAAMVREIEEEINSLIQRIKRRVYQIIGEALQGGLGEEAAQECRENYPVVWEDYRETLQIKKDLVSEDDEFLSFVDI